MQLSSTASLEYIPTHLTHSCFLNPCISLRLSLKKHFSRSLFSSEEPFRIPSPGHLLSNEPTFSQYGAQFKIQHHSLYNSKNQPVLLSALSPKLSPECPIKILSQCSRDFIDPKLKLLHIHPTNQFQGPKNHMVSFIHSNNAPLLTL